MEDQNLTRDYARNPSRYADQGLPFGLQMSDRVLLDNGQENGNRDNENVEIDGLGVRLAKPAADKACRIGR